MGLSRYIKNLFRHDRNTRRQLNDLSLRLDKQSKELYVIKELQRKAYLQDKVMNSTEMGVSAQKLCDEEVVVSLTSYGPRINEVYLAIESIMQGTVKPNRIILWLAEDEFKGKRLPISMQKQQERGLEIAFYKDIRSYKKIIPAMLQFPESCIITIDDDLMYEFDLVEHLINAHLNSPDDVCACRMHHITLNEKGEPKGYLQWQMEVNPKTQSNLNFLTTGGGTLFPPHCFVDEFFNEEKFMTLCPYADDVWVNSMIWMSNRKIAKVYTHSKQGCDYMEISLEQEKALSNENTNPNNCRNDAQIKAVLDYYDLYHYLSE